MTDETFERDVLSGERPVVVDFWAPWCGPCKAVERVLLELEEEHGGFVAFTRLDVDSNPVFAGRFRVLSLPTAILFDGGEARETVVGARSRSHYERVWAPWLAAQPRQQ